MIWIVRKLISPWFQCTSITHCFPSLFDRLRAYYNWWYEMWENSFFRDFSAQVSHNVFIAYLNVLRLITTLWPEMSENSNLRHFSAQISQIVFLSFLTVLQLITAVWPEMSENSSLRDFSAQVTQIVFLAYLIALQAYYNYMSFNLIKLVSPRFEWTNITNRVLSLF